MPFTTVTTVPLLPVVDNFLPVGGSLIHHTRPTALSPRGPIADKGRTTQLIPAEVIKYIEEHGLYHEDDAATNDKGKEKEVQ